jgi:thiol:disulfide interchange protein
MKNFIKTALAGGAYFLPALALAQGFERTLETFRGLIDSLIPIVFGLALLAFFWGLAMYLFSFSGDDKEKKKGRALMIYGVLVLFVAASIWGIVGLLQDTFEIEGEQDISAPGVADL